MPDLQAATQRSPTATLLLVSLGVFFTALDQTVVVTVLPPIMTDLKVGIGELDRASWIITGYLLGYTVAIPLIARLADVYGYARLFMVALALFAVGSALVAAASGAHAPVEDVPHLADAPGFQECLHLPQAGLEPQGLSRHEQATAGLGGGHHGVGVGHGQGQGLLDEDVSAGAQAGEGVSGVQVVRGADEDRIHRLRLKGGVQVEVQPLDAVVPAQAVVVRLVGLDGGGHRGQLRDAGDPLQVGGSHAAAADEQGGDRGHGADASESPRSSS